MQPQAQPRAFEAGMAGDEDFFALPEITIYHYFLLSYQPRAMSILSLPTPSTAPCLSPTVLPNDFYPEACPWHTRNRDVYTPSVVLLWQSSQAALSQKKYCPRRYIRASLIRE